MNRTFPVALVLLGSAAVGSCGRSEPSGPPELRLGRDECAECGMLINDGRSACAALVDRAGRAEHAMFDDLGCLLEFLHDRSGDQTVKQAWVCDYTNRAWSRAESAVYLFVGDGRLPTPMGSGIAAFAGADGARAVQAERGGELMDWPAVARARRAWMEEHYGKPADRP